MPRSNRRCCPGWGGDCFGGKSSTRIATFFIRLRNSSGSESSESSTTLTKCSRFILHPLTNEGHAHTEISAIFVVIIIPFFGVTFVFLFLVFFLVWFFAKADIGYGGAIRRV